MPKFGWPEGHGEKRREEIRKFQREEAGTLAKSRMAELEREQQGQTRREGMKQAGEMARAKLGGGSGGFTASQMANLRKSAYGAADTEIERRRELMPGEPGAFFIGKGENQIPMTDEQIAMARESIASKYLQGYMGGEQAPVEQAPTGQGWAEVKTGKMKGTRYNLEGGTMTREAPAARVALPDTSLPTEPTEPTGTTAMPLPTAKKIDPRQIAAEQVGIKPAYKAPLKALKRSILKPIKKYTPRSYLQLFKSQQGY